jgi:hypothetical protein
MRNCPAASVISRALMIAQVFLVALGAFRGRLLVLSPTADHHAHRAGFCTGIHPHYCYYDVTRVIACRSVLAA